MADATANMIDDRPMKPAIWRAVRGTCPNCGKGRLFDRYLKVTHTCDHCQTELHHHRADDGPAYLTILVVAHILGLAMHVAWSVFRPEPWVMATVFTAGSVALCLALLPRFKGMIVAIQWSRRMHGFDGSDKA